MANPNDKKDYIRTSLGLATAQICQGLGWHSVQRSSHDVLTDVLERYLSLVSKRAALVSQTCCRTAPNLDDVVLAFKQLGIHIHELQDYMQQVEASAPLKCIPKVPIQQKSTRLLDFSGEDFLPPLIDVSVKEEEIIKEEPEDASADPNDESTKGERPKTITFRTDSVESPPYSPLEPKSLNLNALQNMDLTRPDLKVTTPKGYTPTLTTRPVVATISSLVNSTVKSPSPVERKRTPTPTLSKSQSKSESKASKKEKKESKKTESPQSLLSPPSNTKSPSPKLSKKTKPASPSPSVLAAKEKEREQKEQEKKENEQKDKERREKEKREKEQRDREKREQKEREKEEKAREKQEREREKQEQKEREKQEKEREKERQKQQELELKKERERQDEEERLAQMEREQSDPFDEDPPSSPDHTYLLHAPRPDSPSSTLFSPPRVRIASYQSDKKKPSSKDKGKKEKKESKEEKKSKHKKKSSALSSPASSIGSLKSPPSAKSDLLSPPKLSQPIIKQEKPSKKTVMFPPDSSSEIVASPARHALTSPDEQKSIKQEDEESPLKISPISSSSKYIKKESKNITDVSENEIDVTTFSQGEEAPSSYSESFQPNMFFPTKFKDEKKKKKKKKSEKDRDERLKKKEDKEKKKDRKRKLEESPIPSTTSSSAMIPKLTLKMGSEKISDEPPPAKIPKKRAESPPLSLKAVLMPSASQTVKKKKDKKKDKHKDRSRDFDGLGDEDSNSGFYVESQTDTAHSYDNKVYYCPGCGKPDDGSPMIGCDRCDDWYHWPCVDIVEEPAEDEKWFCPNCPGGVPKKKKKKKKRDD